MAEPVFKLDIECHEDGHSKRIRVPIGGHEPVRRLLEKVRERSHMGLTTLYTVRDGDKALLDPGDTLDLVLDAGENKLRAEAVPGTGTVTAEPPQAPVAALALSAKASAPPPPRTGEVQALGLRSRSRSPARRKSSQAARLLELRDRQRSVTPDNDNVFVVKQAFSSRSQDSRRRSGLLSVRPGDILELAMSRDRGWLACRQFTGQRDVGWVPEWVFRAPQKACDQEEDLSDESEEPSSHRGPRAKGCIKRIKAITGQYVDRVEFQLRSGIHQVYGESTGGCKQKWFFVKKDEAVVEVTQIRTHKYLAQMLEFKTSRGRVFSTKGYGGPGKEPQTVTFAAPEGRQICGLVFEGVKLSAVCHQTCSQRGSRKHPQKLVKDFMSGFQSKLNADE
ncbi:unnamed protein product [Symbiodinium necroappetens]|uniref:Jacalin-type lectin domain-containing protein n=1 Tax=Symbiodinium necroappetens TaxID=1628268 RepID=A0A813C2U6_9DINO|nr:unnamed protein product [Symbiodinium necroappetens]